jgi:hypothetical protein
MQSLAYSLEQSSDYGPYRTSFSLQGVPVSNHFVARPSATAELEECLLPRRRSQETKRRIFVLYGLGGIGKTQLAADFARRHQAAFSSVFWLDGRSEGRLMQSLASCAARIPEGQIPQRSRSPSFPQLNMVSITTITTATATPQNATFVTVNTADEDQQRTY